MTPMLLGLSVEKLQPKVDLGGYVILFAYFVVEAKSKIKIIFPKNMLEKEQRETQKNYKK